MTIRPEVKAAMDRAAPEPDIIGSLRIWAQVFAMRGTEPPELILDLMTAAELLEKNGAK